MKQRQKEDFEIAINAAAFEIVITSMGHKFSSTCPTCQLKINCYFKKNVAIEMCEHMNTQHLIAERVGNA